LTTTVQTLILIRIPAINFTRNVPLPADKSWQLPVDLQCVVPQLATVLTGEFQLTLSLCQIACGYQALRNQANCWCIYVVIGNWLLPSTMCELLLGFQTVIAVNLPHGTTDIQRPLTYFICSSMYT